MNKVDFSLLLIYAMYILKIKERPKQQMNNKENVSLKEYLKEKQKELFDKQKQAVEAIDVSQGYYAYQLSEMSSLNEKPSFSFLMKIIDGWGLNFLEVMQKAGYITNDLLVQFFKKNSNILESKNNIIDIFLFHGNKIACFDDLTPVGSMFFETQYKDSCGIKTSQDDGLYDKNELLIIQKTFDMNDLNSNDICAMYSKTKNKIKYFTVSKNKDNNKVLFVERNKSFHMEINSSEFDNYLVLGLVKHVILDVNGSL